jgi:hypothetical protein
MFGIKPKLMKCTFELAYIYDPLTYLKTIRAIKGSHVWYQTEAYEVYV